MKIFTLRNALRLILLMLSVYGFWVFLQPVIISGIINIGNIVGMGFSALLAVVVLFSSRASRFLSARMKQRRGKITIVSAAALLGCGALWCGVLSVLMATAMITQPESPTTVIVLGCRVNGDTPSASLLRRVDTAADYLLANPSVQVIVSGGQGAHEWISEAEAMKRVLVQRGVSEDRILMEDRSTSTLENLTFSQEMLAENGLSTSVVVVSEGYHMYRALSFAERIGLDAEGLAAPTVPWILPTSWVREWFGITLDTIRR
ncbi:uncharacterized SAM-binding protein YcdF (DUF218 family) [Sanguibacter antarcticus]|uniref:Uncharacterized SAM-binding protein YcdF (DUF218 family) n=1 Tax=Sanguibacter antarcticus TaxID=372484 RepID=A0A2A9E7H1_9MICO|nr:uncharacterized SAM-binding protein YcdF (DUF218 family) [Sanguibacter antarcticus]